MQIPIRPWARRLALATALAFAPVLLGGAAPASAEDNMRLHLRWLASDDPGSGGVYTDTLAASPGDTGTLGVFASVGPRGLGGYRFDFVWDEDLADGLDLLEVKPTPPPGWIADGIPQAFESDATRPGRIQGLGASGVGAAPVVDDEVQIAHVRFLLTGNVRPDAPTYITPSISGFLLDGSYQAIDAADVELEDAGAERQSTENEPTFNASIRSYRYVYDLGGVQIKTAPILKETAEEPTRGTVFKAQSDGAYGFYATDFHVGSEFEFTQRIDAVRHDTPGGFIGAEFATPRVAFGVVPQTFFFAGAARQADGSLAVFASDSGTPVGQTQVFMEDEVEVNWSFVENHLWLSAGPVGSPEKEIIVDAHPFPYAGSGGFGIGVSGAGRGDIFGSTFAITGDIYAAQRKKLLTELDAVIKLERDAEKRVDLGDYEGAKEKLKEAEERIEEGKRIPGTKPPRYEDSLRKQVDAVVPDAKLAKKTSKRLQKAADKDARAIQEIDKASSPEKVKKFIRSGTKRKLQAKAMIEFGTPKEKPKTM